jgi:hypothetical protein
MPRAKMPKSKAASQEPRAKSQEPRTKFQEPGSRPKRACTQEGEDFVRGHCSASSGNRGFTPTKKGAENTSMSTKQLAVIMTMPTKKLLHQTEQQQQGRKLWMNKAPKKTASEAAALFSGGGARRQSLSIKFAMTSNLQMKQMDKTSSTSTPIL